MSQKSTRQEDPTAFTAQLEELVRASPGAVAAVFSDLDGEAIDYFSFVDVFDAKLGAAHWSSVLAALRSVLESLRMGSLSSVHIRAGRMDFLILEVGSGYYVTLLLEHGAGWGHALASCERALEAIRREGGLSPGP